VLKQLRVFWVESDSRILPFSDVAFDGVYCFGLLHEFVGESSKTDVNRTMLEIHRVLKPSGVAIVAVAAGDPVKGLLHVQNFSEAMFDAATAGFSYLEKKLYDDLGCTGRTDYKVWFGFFVKP
jgi:SAM-dependent methyltransferase